MKTPAALLVLITALAVGAPANAQQSLRGEWRVEEVNGQQPPDGSTLTLTFDANGDAMVTYALDGDTPQSWQYTFTVEQSILTLKPKKPFGEPDEVKYEIRFEEGKLQFLEPKPEEEEDSEEDEGEDAEEGAGEDTGEGEDDTDSTEDDETPEEEEEEEEDNREPVWVLTPAS